MCDNTLDWMFINQFSIPENNNIQITLYFKHFTNTYHLFLFLSHHKLYCVYIIFFFSLGVGYSILNTPNRSMWSPLVIEEKHTKKTYLMKFCNHLIFFFIGFNHFICLWLVSISLIEIFQYRRGYILQTKSSKITRTFLRLNASNRKTGEEISKPPNLIKHFDHETHKFRVNLVLSSCYWCLVNIFF